MCEQRKHGSVGAGAGNRPGYPTAVALTGRARRRRCLDIPGADPRRRSRRRTSSFALMVRDARCCPCACRVRRGGRASRVEPAHKGGRGQQERAGSCALPRTYASGCPAARSASSLCEQGWRDSRARRSLRLMACPVADAGIALDRKWSMRSDRGSEGTSARAPFRSSVDASTHRYRPRWRRCRRVPRGLYRRRNERCNDSGRSSRACRR